MKAFSLIILKKTFLKKTDNNIRTKTLVRPAFGFLRRSEFCATLHFYKRDTVNLKTLNISIISIHCANFVI